MKLRIVPAEGSVVREIVDWADMGRGGRWIVGNLNARGTTLRGAKFSNSNVAGILSRGVYTGTYYDKTADDEGNTPDPEDWIAVPCPAIIELDQFERVAALRASRNPRKTAPHIAAGTTMLMGIARCDEDVDRMLSPLPVELVPADAALAREAGRLRRHTVEGGLSLGDRFCLALAKRDGLPAWTSDRKWKDIAPAAEVKVVAIR